MPHLKKCRLPGDREVWIDRNQVVVAPVRSGDSHEDEKEERERRIAEAFVRHLHLLPDVLTRPTDSTHDFDLVGEDGVVRLSLEVKGLTWPAIAMGRLHRSNEAVFSLPDFEGEIRKDLDKAQVQLLGAAGEEKVVLVVWSYDDGPDEGWRIWLRSRVAEIAADLNISAQVWITTPRANDFERLR